MKQINIEQKSHEKLKNFSNNIGIPMSKILSVIIDQLTRDNFGTMFISFLSNIKTNSDGYKIREDWD